MGKVLVIGSTGKVGRALAEELALQGASVHAATRHPEVFPSSPGLEPVAFDYLQPETFARALAGVDRVFLMEPQPPLDGLPHTYMTPFLELAARECKIVLMSSATVGLDPNEPLGPVEDAVETSGRPYVILRPNWFMDNFHTMWREAIVQAGVIPLPAGDGRYAFVDSRDVAAAAAAALLTDRSDGKTLTVTGPEALTFHEAAETLSEASGREIHYVAIDDADFTATLLQVGLPADFAKYLTYLFQLTRKGDAATVTTAVRDLTGRSPRTFAEYARDHADAWR